MAKTKTSEAPRLAVDVAAELDAVNTQRDTLKAAASTLAAELDVSTAYEAYAAKISEMPDDVREGLVQAIAAHGIPSTTTVGDVGTDVAGN